MRIAALVGVLALVCIFIVSMGGCSKATTHVETLTHGRFRNVHIYAPKGEVRHFVLFLSGDGGWGAALGSIAESLATTEGTLVAGIDTADLFENLEKDGGDCVFPVGDLENLSHFVQAYYKVPTYFTPILVGHSAGASFAYAALAQARPGTFIGALSLSFCADFDLHKPLCKAGDLQFTARADGGGVRLVPPKQLHAPWIALHGTADAVCSLAEARTFVARTPGASFVELPGVNHNYGGVKNWLPQFNAAFASIAARDTRHLHAPPSSLADLPIIEVPAGGASGSAGAGAGGGAGGGAAGGAGGGATAGEAASAGANTGDGAAGGAGADSAANARTGAAANSGTGAAANSGTGAAANSGTGGPANSGAGGAANSGTGAAANSGTGAAANSGTGAAANSGTGAASSAGTPAAANAGASAGANAGASTAANAGTSAAANADAGDATSAGAVASDTFAILLSGDGGWAGLDKDVADVLSQRGIPVAGLDSLRYFWTPRTPAGVAADIDRMLRYYAQHWGRKRALLIGYSQGADVLPFAVNRLPPESRALVKLTVLIGIGASAAFEFHVSNWIGSSTDELPTGVELARMSAADTLCLYGDGDDDSICPKVAAAHARVIRLPGGHHFGGNYDGLANLILQRPVAN